MEDADKFVTILSKTEQERLDKIFVHFARIEPPNLKYSEFLMFIFDRGLINERIGF